MADYPQRNTFDLLEVGLSKTLETGSSAAAKNRHGAREGPRAIKGLKTG